MFGNPWGLRFGGSFCFVLKYSMRTNSTHIVHIKLSEFLHTYNWHLTQERNIPGPLGTSLSGHALFRPRPFRSLLHPARGLDFWRHRFGLPTYKPLLPGIIVWPLVSSLSSTSRLRSAPIRVHVTVVPAVTLPYGIPLCGCTTVCHLVVVGHLDYSQVWAVFLYSLWFHWSICRVLCQLQAMITTVAL